MVDYGVGNLFSLKCALERAGFSVSIASLPSQLEKTDAIVMPGVGSFSAASQNLEPFKSKIIELAEGGVPLLGVCLGMQLIFAESEEGKGSGLSLFPGRVVRLPSSVKIPHMGWNTLHVVRQNELLDDVREESFVYFVHSYYSVPLNQEVIVAETTYEVTFASVIAEHDVYGTQFHPEKSGETGLTLLRNFAKIAKR
ncbi:MAG: imidazole glycerol phosphate synthase subunit HisH [Candidatus Bathyarchaeia archaeon]